MPTTRQQIERTVAEHLAHPHPQVGPAASEADTPEDESRLRFFFIVREDDGATVATIATRGDARQARRCAAAMGIGVGPKYNAREVSRHGYAGSLERSGFFVTQI
jgi:hypothetical protein